MRVDEARSDSSLRQRLILGVTVDVGSDEGTERDDGEVLRARVLEPGMGERIGDAMVLERCRNLGVDEVDLPGGAPVLEHGARAVEPREKLMRGGIVFDDDVVRMWSRHRS